MAKYAKFLKDIKLMEFPEFRQTFRWDCGAQAIQCILAFNDIDEFEEDIMKMASTNEETGTPIKGLKKVADEYKLKYKEGTWTVDDLKRHVDKGWPTLIMLQAWTTKDSIEWSKEWGQGHYAIAVGYDDKRILFEDPDSIKRTFLTYEELEERWRGWDDNDEKIYNWGMVFTNDSQYFQNDMEPMG